MNYFFRKSFDRKIILICFCLILAIATLYWQTADYGFINLDDRPYVSENPHVQHGLSLGGITWAFSSFYASNWHPLTWISHMADCQLFGLNAGRHHLVNVFFHIANTILLFLILNRMTRALWQSAFVAALFALHPLHVESVAWAAERKDVLSTLFWMLTMGAYAFYVEQPSTRRYLPTLLFFALGLMAKPMLVTLPFVLLLLDYWPLDRFHLGSPEPTDKRNAPGMQKRTSQKIPLKKAALSKSPKGKTDHQFAVLFPLIREKIPFFGLSVISSVITFIAQKEGGAVEPLQALPLAARIDNACISYVRYIIKTVWPQNLAVFYPYNKAWALWLVISSALFIITTTLLFIRVAKRYPYLTVGWFWYLITLVPVIGLVQVGSQSIADRYTYIPLIGLFIMIVWGMADFTKACHLKNTAKVLSAMVVISILMVLTWRQIQYWKNDLSLFGHALTVTTGNYKAHSGFGNALCDEGKFDEAIAHFQEALRINPNFSEGQFSLANALTYKGEISNAVSNYEKTLRMKPNYAEAHYNFGIVLIHQGKIDEAIEHFLMAIQYKPDYAKAHNNLGSALLLKGRVAEAIRHFQEALKLNPDSSLAKANLKDAIVIEQHRGSGH